MIERRRIRVTGTVQGVGYRPFVYRTATALGLSGCVSNDSAGVVIEAQGERARIDELCRRLRDDAPPLARVGKIDSALLPLSRDADRAETRGTFAIRASADDGRPDAPVSPDVAPCAACLAEVADPHDRRFGYPFTNCTNCGPRYTIVRAVPYDRQRTTMAAFTMCDACQREYDDPGSRRFHAQPNACPRCGPRLTLEDTSGGVIAQGPRALDGALERLLGGRIVAVKGVGGYHLAADATNDAAVAELRRRKHRDDKPFALMVPDAATAAALCVLDEAALRELQAPARPILLAPRRPDPGVRLADGIAPWLCDLGVMLPSTPLHQLLLEAAARPLVMTSGNVSDEPIAHDDDDARTRLGPLVDALLTHDRPIHIRCDDSVVRAAPPDAAQAGPDAAQPGPDAAQPGPDAAQAGVGPQMVRRSRGYAPAPLRLPVRAAQPVLAVGAELKNTIAVARGDEVVLSHHIGDLEHYPTYEAFLQAVEHLTRVFGVAPAVVAHDLHPEYLSTKFARDLDLPLEPVQHHHAHIASCLAENGVTQPVLGVAFDGLGYGGDGTMWGGEFLVADLRSFRRVGHLAPVPLPGGAAAVREPWRMGLVWLQRALGEEAAARHGPQLDVRWEAVLRLAESALTTTSVGRLFDAAAALLGVRSMVTYEGQAAAELEAAAAGAADRDAPHYPYEITEGEDATVLDPAPLLAAVVSDRDHGVPLAQIAADFHATLAEATARVAADLASAQALDTVALSGGVFQNARLTRLVTQRLDAAGLRVLRHRAVPCNDGGISLGQSAIAAARGENSVTMG